MFISHPLIKEGLIESRAYQTNIARACMGHSTLVVLPTGMGKTVIALLVIADRLEKEPGKRILFMAPTKPLVEQHAQFLGHALSRDQGIAVFTGEVPPARRLAQWRDNQIVLATPQVISNDLVSGRISLDDVSLVIFDEAHRAVGEYAYVFVAERYKGVQGLTLGITASPGSDASKILEVCGNLNIAGVEIRSKYDPDVVSYVHDIKLRWLRIDLPSDYSIVLRELGSAMDGYFKELKRYGFLRTGKRVSTKDLLAVGVQIRERLKGKVKSPSLFQAASVQAEAMKVNHGIELLETQGISAFRSYMDRIVAEANSRGSSKAAKNMLKNEHVLRAMELSKGIKLEHPKLARVISEVARKLDAKKDARIIVFTHYRDTSELVMDRLNRHHGVRAARFVGQASREGDKGLRQREQVELIQRFKDGEFNVLVATSVAEEGLDIPSTDMVVFFEPVPSEIRTIQRRGRTGRKMPGEVVILVTRGTRDEAYYWSSQKKEKGMHLELEALRRYLRNSMIVGEPDASAISPSDIQGVEEEREKLKGEKKKRGRRGEGPHKVEKAPPLPKIQRPGQKSLLDFPEGEEQLTIIVDNREFNSPVVKELARRDIVVSSQQLEVADYVIGERVGVERKEVGDFLDSLLDGRLFQQVKALRHAFLRPLMVIEGEGLFTKRNISEAAIMGALASIATDFNVPLIFTADGKETALLLATLVKREGGPGRNAPLRSGKGGMNVRERQQFILEGLPSVSGVMAQRLLSEFHTLQAIANASPEELAKVKGIGKKTAENIAAIFRERSD